MREFTLIGAEFADGTNANITVSDGRIAEIGKQVVGERVECSGLFVSPGLVDIHTHLRQPGFEDSETVLTGSRSAVAGGYTAVLAMANTNPVADNPTVTNRVAQLGRQAGLLHVQPVGAITKGLLGEELASMHAMLQSEAKVSYFSDDGMCVSNRKLMRDALAFSAKYPVVIAQHAQEPSLTIDSQMNDGALADELGLRGWPAEAEESVIASDIALAIATGGRLHICHLTTGAALDVVRWGKAKGARISCEVTPHHLLLTEEMVRGYDSTYKVNPPLRTASDVAALRQGLEDGTIDAVATDHAPHSVEKKACEWQNAAFGMVGLEAAASVVQQVLQDTERWRERFAQVLSQNPASIAQLTNQGQIQVGLPANLSLFDIAVERTLAETTHSKSSNNPYRGMTLPGRVVHTIFNGTFSMRDGVVRDV